MFGTKKKDEHVSTESISKVHTNPKNWPGLSQNFIRKKASKKKITKNIKIIKEYLI